VKNDKETKGMEVKATDKPEYVEVLHNGDIWDINYAGRGKFSVFKGQTVKFNVHNRQELRALISVVKEVNRPKGNERSQVKKEGGQAEYIRIKRFEIVGGREYLPEIILKMQYTSSGIPLDNERDAIVSICPDFFEKK